MIYLAIEPYARRRWPEQLIATMRLLGGRVRDPLVGRHILIGVLAGAGHFALSMSARVMAGAAGDDAARAVSLDRRLGNAWDALVAVADGATAGLAESGLYIIALVLFTIVLRKKALAAAGLFVLVATFFFLAFVDLPAAVPSYLAVAVLLTFIAVRYGVLAFAVAQGTCMSLLHAPLLAGAGWATAISPLSLVAIAALTLWAFYISLGGQSPFSAALLDE
jgi:hypothetical protein